MINLNDFTILRGKQYSLLQHKRTSCFTFIENETGEAIEMPASKSEFVQSLVQATFQGCEDQRSNPLPQEKRMAAVDTIVLGLANYMLMPDRKALDQTYNMKHATQRTNTTPGMNMGF